VVAHRVSAANPAPEPIHLTIHQRSQNQMIVSRHQLVLFLKSFSDHFEVSLHECHLDHSCKVDYVFFVACKYAATFFKPSDQAFDDVALAKKGVGFFGCNE